MLRLALEDIKKALIQYRVWWNLGSLEVKQRYRRSVLGPWWITITMLVFILAMGSIFSRLFGQSLETYMPFFTTGFLIWSFISTSINEATDLFKNNGGFIKQIKQPFNLYLFKFFVKNTIILAHNFIVYFLVIIYFQINPGWNALYAIPGFILLLINLYWICLLVALVSTRFCDMIPIINSCLQILFLITPISWNPKLLGTDSILVKLNPFVYFVDMIRGPLLGIAPSLLSWEVTTSLACGGLILTFLIFSAVRSCIPFWID